jgi:hypothetical protein
MFFSNPMVTTRNGSPSDKRTMLMGTPSLVVTSSPKRKAKIDEISTLVASQKLEPIRRIERNSETNVRCMEMYPRTMTTISRVSAFLSRSINSVQPFKTQRLRLLRVWTRAAFMIHIFFSWPYSDVSRFSTRRALFGISWATDKNSGAWLYGREKANELSCE